MGPTISQMVQVLGVGRVQAGAASWGKAARLGGILESQSTAQESRNVPSAICKTRLAATSVGQRKVTMGMGLVLKRS